MGEVPFERLERLRIGNVWLYDGGAHGRWLVDSGHRFERPLILSALRRRGLAPTDLAGVLLTHRHSDHAGNAAFFREQGVRVLAHRADAAILEGAAPRPKMPWDKFGQRDLIASTMTLFENRMPSEVPGVEPVEDGQTIAGLRVLWAPGHTEGSLLLFHERTGALATGDAIINAIPPVAQREGLSLPHPTFSTDIARAHASLVALYRNGPEIEHLCTGHGPPVIGAAKAKLGALLRQNGLA